MKINEYQKYPKMTGEIFMSANLSLDEMSFNEVLNILKKEVQEDYINYVLPAITSALKENKNELPYLTNTVEKSEYGYYFLGSGHFHTHNILFELLNKLLKIAKENSSSKYHFKRTVLVRGLKYIVGEGFEELFEFNSIYSISINAENEVRSFLNRYTSLGYVTNDEKTHGFYYFENDELNDILSVTSFKNLLDESLDKLKALNLYDKSITKEENRRLITLSSALIEDLERYKDKIKAI